MSKRTPEEIANDLREQLAKAEAKAAIANAENDPALSPVVEALSAIKDALTEARKGFNSGPQSYKQRILSHSAWLDEIEAFKSANEAAIKVLTAERSRIQEGLSNLSNLIAEGETPPAEDLEALSTFDISEVAPLFKAAEDAKMFRQSLKSKRQKKSNTNSENS